MNTRQRHTKREVEFKEYAEAVARVLSEALLRGARDERLDPARWPGMTGQDFSVAVYYALGQALAAHEDALRRAGCPPDVLAWIHGQVCAL